MHFINSKLLKTKKEVCLFEELNFYIFALILPVELSNIGHLAFQYYSSSLNLKFCAVNYSYVDDF